MSLSVDNANVVLKRVYENQNNLTAKLRGVSPTYARIRKKQVPGGRTLNHSVQTGSAQSVSSNFKEAFDAAVNNTLGPHFSGLRFPWDEYHASWSIQSKAIKQMPMKGPGSFINASRRLVTSTEETVEKMRTLHMFSDRQGYIGKVTGYTTASDRVIAGADRDFGLEPTEAFYKFQLTDPSHITQFEKGLRFQMAASLTASSVAKTTGADPTDLTFEVKHVSGDEKDPVLYASIVSPGIAHPGRAVTTDFSNYYIFRVGDFANKGTFLPGFKSWCPSTLANDDNFFGLNRSEGKLNPVQRNNNLAGYYFDLTGAYSSSADDFKRFQKTIDRIIEAAGIAEQRGASPDYYCVHPRLFRYLVTELGQKVELEIKDDGLKVYKIHGGNGYISLYQDSYCPIDEVFGLNFNDWAFVSLGDFIDKFDHDGNVMRRVQGENLISGAVSSYATLICANPNNFIRMKVPTVLT